MFDLQPLTFPQIPYGSHGTRIDLLTLLYKGAAGTLIYKQWEQINKGYFGEPITSRLPLVKAIHNELSTLLAKGQAKPTVINKIRAIRKFYDWCDRHDKDINHNTAEMLFREWAEYYYLRSNIKKEIKTNTAYYLLKNVDLVLSTALGLNFGIMRSTRLQSPIPKSQLRLTRAGKQDLSELMKFGHMLFDISNGLNLEQTFAPLPVIIKLRDGQHLQEWSGLRPDDKVIAFRKSNAAEIKSIKATREAWSKNPARRQSLINLRIQVELLIFIAQTGMNLAQAARIKNNKFRYRTDTTNILVFRAFKGRRAGEVEFKIFKEYKTYFQRYIAWRNAVTAPEDERLFPFTGSIVIPSILSVPSFEAVKRRCKRLGIKFISPRTLRFQRVNWLLRLSQDDDLVAEMAQHTKETLITQYEQPNHQIAAIQITKFYKNTDFGVTASGPGKCINISSLLATAKDISQIPLEPDCITPAGCLFCEFHRDVDSEDYVWSLTTFKTLKALELDHFIPPTKVDISHPAKFVIEKITEKLEAFSQSSELRKTWVAESELKMLEGKYHPTYDKIIQLMEL